ARGEQGRLPIADAVSIGEPLLARRRSEVLRAFSVQEPKRQLAILARVGLSERSVAFETEDEKRGRRKRVDEPVQQGGCAQREPKRLRLRSVGDPAQRLRHRGTALA